MTKYNFTSSSSSLLWTLLLSSVYFLVGINEYIPFVLNTIFTTLILCVTYYFMRYYKLDSFYVFCVLLSIIFFTPLPAVAFTGMEHILHTLLTISFVFISAQVLTKVKGTFFEYFILMTLAPLVTMVRYEGLFLILVVSILFIMRKQLLWSLLVTVAAIIPIVSYGAISISNGWFFLPNSILLKGNAPAISSIRLGPVFYGFIQRITTPHILVLVFLSTVLFIYQLERQKTLYKDTSLMLIIFIATTLIHMLFAISGGFFRYEAYLVALGISVTSIVAHEYHPKRISIKLGRDLIPKYAAILLLVFLIVLPLATRGTFSLLFTPQATTNIYEQQYQMGLFIRQFYNGMGAAMNDIGAINYLSDIRCLDLWGLSSIEVARARREGVYNTQMMYDLAKQKNIKVAIVYDHWFEGYGGIPAQWVKVGEWKIMNNIICGGDTVSFYAVDPSEENKLIKSLRAFSLQLPKSVIQNGRYVGTTVYN